MCHHLTCLSTVFPFDQTCQRNEGCWSVTQPAWCWQVTGRFSDEWGLCDWEDGGWPLETKGNLSSNLKNHIHFLLVLQMFCQLNIYFHQFYFPNTNKCQFWYWGAFMCKTCPTNNKSNQSSVALFQTYFGKEFLRAKLSNASNSVIT